MQTQHTEVLNTDKEILPAKKLINVVNTGIPTIYTREMLEKIEKSQKEEKRKISSELGVANSATSFQPVMSTTIIYKTDKIQSANLMNILGIKIDLRSKIEKFKDEYVKNYAMSKSHNLLVGRFAALKFAFYGMMLSFLGVSAEEISEMQKRALNNLISQNLLLLEENEYAGEMLEIMGGPKKRIKAEKAVIIEVRKQLTTQISNCGRKDLVSEDKILLIQKNQCKKIVEKLTEEKNSLEYELSMVSFGIYAGNETETKLKLEKIGKYLNKAKRRLENYENKIQKNDSLEKLGESFLIKDNVRIRRKAMNNAC